MDKKYYKSIIWPHMFYMSYNDIWRWKMNVARAMGNTHDRNYVPELILAFGENKDERVKGMIAWALGNLGGEKSKEALKTFLSNSEGLVVDEVTNALSKLKR
jgi:epoxyqueuosine reductase